MLSKNCLHMYDRLVEKVGSMDYIVESTSMQDDRFFRVLFNRVIDEENSVSAEFRMVVQVDEFDRPFYRLWVDSHNFMMNGKQYRLDGHIIGDLFGVSFVVRMIETFIHD